MAIPPEAKVTHVRLFGEFQIERDGNPVDRTRSPRKDALVLALLLLRHETGISRSTLAFTVWPDIREENALFNLRRSLTQLKTIALRDAYCLQNLQDDVIRLCMDALEVDVLEFDALMRDGSTEAIQRAVELYRGPLLKNVDEHWAESERNDREQKYLNALLQLARKAVAAHDPQRAIDYLNRAIFVDSLQEEVQEEATGILMQALAERGDPGDLTAITRVYQALARRLHDSLGESPSPETDALYQHLCKTVRERKFYPPPPIDPRPHPRRRLSELIGREQEVDEVCGWLGKSRLVTLVGAGGVGKTRLAEEVGWHLWHNKAACPHGVPEVELASVSDPALVAQKIATALKLHEEPGSSIEETLVGELASRSLVLVLDNCEHLMEECSRLVDRMLKGCDRLRILATSRQSLGLGPSEVVWRVPSLSLPALPSLSSYEKDIVSHLLDYGAIRLFVQRASIANARSSFHLTPQNAPVVAQICHRLDGIPLAIELAAARVRSLSVEEISSRLDDLFRLLTGGDRSALLRHQTLRALIDWSYDLLNTREQMLLNRLSVFAGGWTLAAAEKVGTGECATGATIDDWEVVDLLASLVDKSIVEYEVVDEGGRYHFLDTVRQYAWERLQESGESDAARDRHRDYFLALAEDAEPKLHGPEQREWLLRLEEAHENLRAALNWSLSGSDPGAGLRFCGALSRFWCMRGHLAGGRNWCARALEKGGMARTSERAKALHGAGILAYHQGDFASSGRDLEESLAISRAIEDQSGIAHSLIFLGLVDYMQDDFASSGRDLEESLAIFRAIDNPRGIASSLNALGGLAEVQGEYPLALSYYKQSLMIFRKVGDRSSTANALTNVGYRAHFQGNDGDARSYLEESLVICREIGDRSTYAYSLCILGLIARSQGDYGSARSYPEESLDIFREIGDRRGIAYSLRLLGNVAHDQGDYASERAYRKENTDLGESLLPG